MSVLFFGPLLFALGLSETICASLWLSGSLLPSPGKLALLRASSGPLCASVSFPGFPLAIGDGSRTESSGTEGPSERQKIYAAC